VVARAVEVKVDVRDDCDVKKVEIKVDLQDAPPDLDRVVEALEIGADEFLLKPVDPDELRLRIGALVSGKVERTTPVLECGPLRLHVTTQEVWLDGQPLELSPRERSVLQVLLRGRGSVVSKDHIASRIFAMDEEGIQKNIDALGQIGIKATREMFDSTLLAEI